MNFIELSKFNKDIKVAVIGDIMLDKYIVGSVDRISPEAPVPVVDVKEVKHTLGGAANVAANINNLYAKVYGFGVVGADEHGRLVKDMLLRSGIDIDNIYVEHNRQTTLKCRVMAKNHQLVRYDIENRMYISDEITNNMINGLKSIADKLDIVVISDYDKGVITPLLLKNITEICRDDDIPIVSDIKVMNAMYYNNIDYLKLNLPNASKITNIPLYHNSESYYNIVCKIVDELKKIIRYNNLIITLGDKGLVYANNGENVVHIGAIKREVYDVTGAGDTFTATLAASLARGYDLHTACIISTIASAIKVSKVGTYSIKFDELKRFIERYNRGELEWVG